MKVEKAEKPVGKGLGVDLGREKDKSLRIYPGIALDFDNHLKQLTHIDCLKEDYPDLSLTRD